MLKRELKKFSFWDILVPIILVFLLVVFVREVSAADQIDHSNAGSSGCFTDEYLVTYNYEPDFNNFSKAVISPVKDNGAGQVDIHMYICKGNPISSGDTDCDAEGQVWVWDELFEDVTMAEAPAGAYAVHLNPSMDVELIEGLKYNVIFKMVTDNMCIVGANGQASGDVYYNDNFDEEIQSTWQYAWVEYSKRTNPLILYKKANYIDSDGWQTNLVETLGASGFTFLLDYYIWAPDDYFVNVWYSFDDETYTFHASSTVENAYYNLWDSYLFDSFSATSGTETIYFDAYLKTEEGASVATEQFKLVVDSDFLFNNASSTPNPCYYDIDSIYEDVDATTTDGWWDENRYSFEIALRKIGYWLVTPKEETCQQLWQTISELQNQFPLNVYSQVENTFSAINNSIATITPATIPFTPSASTLSLEGDFFNKDMLPNTWGVAWETVYNSARLIVYGLGVFYIIMRILHANRKEGGIE